MDDRTECAGRAERRVPRHRAGPAAVLRPLRGNCDNPLLSAVRSRRTFCGGNTGAGDVLLDIGRRNVEGGGRLDDLRHTSFRGVLGLRGDIADGWNYDVYGLYGTSILSEHFQNDISRTRAQQCAARRDRPERSAGVPHQRRRRSDERRSDLRALCDLRRRQRDPGPAQLSAGARPHRRRNGRAGPERLDFRRPRPVRPQAAHRQRRSRRSRSARNIARRNPSCVPTKPSRPAISPARARRRSTRSVSSTSRKCSPKRACRSCRARPFADTLVARNGLSLFRLRPRLQDRYVQGSACSGRLSATLMLRGSYQRAVRSPNIQELFLQPRVQLDGNTDPCSNDARRNAGSELRGMRAHGRHGRAVRQHPAEPVRRSTTAWSAATPTSRAGGVGYVLVRLRVHAGASCRTSAPPSTTTTSRSTS